MANPTTIMGANALSWIDVDEGGMFQDTAGTTAAAVGDPVRYVPDGAGGGAYLHDGGTVGVPVLRAGYLEFDAAFLRKLVSRASGPLAYGMRIRRVDEIVDDVHGPLIIGGSASEWYNGEWAAFFQNGFFTPDNWFGETNNGGGGGLAAGAVDIFQTLHQDIAGGSATFRLDGLTDTQTLSAVGATSRVWLGGKGVDFGTPSADPGRFDVVRFYVLDAIPDSTELAALEDWLENGDVAAPAAVTYTGPTRANLGGGATGSWSVDIGAESADRLVLLSIVGQTGTPPGFTSATINGQSTTTAILSGSDAGGDDVHYWALIEAPSGTGSQTLSFVLGGSMNEKAGSAWVLRGADAASIVSQFTLDDSFAFQATTTLTVEDGGAIFGASAVFAGESPSFASSTATPNVSTSIETSERGHRALDLDGLTAGSFTFSQNTNFSFAMSAVAIGPAEAGGGTDVDAPVTGVSATGATGTLAATGTATATVTGVSAAGAVGTAAAAISATTTVTGVGATGAVGTLAATGTATAAVTGVSATGQVGTATAAGTENITATVTGVSATGQVGAATAAIVEDATATLTGVEATGTAGATTATGTENVTVELTGVSTTSSLGVAVGVGDADISVAATDGAMGAGPLGAIPLAGAGRDVAVEVTGVAAAAQIGSVQVQTAIVLEGVSAAGAVGTVTATGTATTALTGVEATGAVGTLQVDAEAVASVTGVEATTGLGSVSIDTADSAFVNITGVSATAQVGAATASTDVLIALTGVEATATIGDATVDLTQLVLVTGLGAIADVGAVSILREDTVAALIGLSATASVGAVRVWSRVDTPGTAIWTPIDPSDTTGWTDVTASGGSPWIEIP